MSFRARLRLFFVLIVIVPMLSVAIVLFRLIADNETGKADATIAAQLRTATALYRDATKSSKRAVRAIGADGTLGLALQTGDGAAARRRVRELRSAHRLTRVVLLRGRTRIADTGSASAIAPAAGNFRFRRPRGTLGTLEVSTQTAVEFARLVRRDEGLDVVIREGDRTLASTLPGAPAKLPSPGPPSTVDVGGHSLRAVSFAEPGFAGASMTLTLFAPDANRGHAVRNSFLIAGGILLGFLFVALAFALAVSRSLQAQIASFLDAARRIGQGDFSARAPVEGRDEFADLGAEFNKMSSQLAARLNELRAERARLETSLRRIGETFASNLDRDALLELVVRTAVDGVDARGGRACVRTDLDTPLEERVRVGRVDDVMAALRGAEDEAIASGAGAEATSDDRHALAQPLHGADGTGAVLGVISVARSGRAFSSADRELFGYLAAQAAVSMENVSLHEAAQRQAVTDELTGLFNHRRFQEAMESEAERARRFGQDMSLVMLDIDDFKRVNDTYGHQQGDRVLAAVAHVLRETSREIDAPARYGGEELAVVLPGTDLDGAYNLAERIRAGIEALEVPLPNGDGTLHVTASFGVASLPGPARDARSLLSRADAALYEAKRAGKNKTVRAG